MKQYFSNSYCNVLLNRHKQKKNVTKDKVGKRVKFMSVRILKKSWVVVKTV